MVLAGCGEAGGDDGGDDGRSEDGSRAGTGGRSVTAGADGSGDAAVDAGPAELGGDAGGLEAGLQLAPDALCDRVAEIQCEAEARCCTTVTDDFATCKTKSLAGCSNGPMFDAIAGDPRAAFDAAAATLAFGEYARRAAACDPTLSPWAVSNAGFTSSFAGTLAAGDDCTPPGGLGAGMLELVVALASCRRDQDVACLPMLEQSSSGLLTEVWKCTGRSTDGGPCFTNLNCADGLYCKGGFSPSFDGTCAPAKASGEACTVRTECASAACKQGTCAAEDDSQAVFCL